MDEKKVALNISYDAENDILYCFLGEPREAYSVEVQDGIFARLDPETDQSIGMTVIDFSKRFANHPGDMLTFPPQLAKGTVAHFAEK